ncbi:MAG: transposase family protein [Planctomycetaceae bacterium]
MVGPARNGQRHFANVTDPAELIGDTITICWRWCSLALTATICGADGWVDVERFCQGKWDWFRRYLELPHGVPSHDTFGRVFARLDTGEFLTAMHPVGRSVRRIIAAGPGIADRRGKRERFV